MPPIRAIRRSRRLSHRPSSEELEIDRLRLDESFEHPSLSYPTHADEPLHPIPLSHSPTPLDPSSTVQGIDDTSSSPPELQVQPSIPRSSGKPSGGTRVPRPPNSFLLYRSDFWAKQKGTGCVERDHRQISRIAGICWNKLPVEQRQYYAKRAHQAKLEHAKKYPEYRYIPTFRKRGAAKKNVKRDDTEEVARCEILADFVLKGLEGMELHNAVEKQLKKRALEGPDTHKIDPKGHDRDDGDYKEPFHVGQKAKSKTGRRPRPPPKKSIPPSSLVKLEFSPEIALSQLMSQTAQLFPFVSTSEIPTLNLSEAKTEALESQTTPKSSVAEDDRIKIEYLEPSLGPRQCHDYLPQLRMECEGDKYVASQIIGAPMPCSSSEAAAGRDSELQPLPEREVHGMDLFFDYDASAYIETQDFSIFDGRLIEASTLYLVATDTVKDEFSEWLNYDQMW